MNGLDGKQINPLRISGFFINSKLGRQIGWSSFSSSIEQASSSRRIRIHSLPSFLNHYYCLWDSSSLSAMPAISVRMANNLNFSKHPLLLLSCGDCSNTAFEFPFALIKIVFAMPLILPVLRIYHLHRIGCQILWQALNWFFFFTRWALLKSIRTD